MEFFQFRAKNIRQYDWPTGISIDTHTDRLVAEAAGKPEFTKTP